MKLFIPRVSLVSLSFVSISSSSSSVYLVQRYLCCQICCNKTLLRSSRLVGYCSEKVVQILLDKRREEKRRENDTMSRSVSTLVLSYQTEGESTGESCWWWKEDRIYCPDGQSLPFSFRVHLLWYDSCEFSGEKLVFVPQDKTWQSRHLSWTSLCPSVTQESWRSKLMVFSGGHVDQMKRTPLCPCHLSLLCFLFCFNRPIFLFLWRCWHAFSQRHTLSFLSLSFLTE